MTVPMMLHCALCFKRAAEAFDHMMSGKARFRAVLTMKSRPWVNRKVASAIGITAGGTP